VVLVKGMILYPHLENKNKKIGPINGIGHDGFWGIIEL
jgi:hypothetical protein